MAYHTAHILFQLIYYYRLYSNYKTGLKPATSYYWLLMFITWRPLQVVR